MAIMEKIELFKRDIGRLEGIQVVRRHLTFGSCDRLTDDQYFHLRELVAKRFRIHPSEIFVVGSSKLGFSIAPQKRYRFFCETSDIDDAIVSPLLFDEIWLSVFRYDQEKSF